MKLWVVRETRGMTYEGDTYISGVYSTQEAAAEAVRLLEGQQFRPDEAAAEEFELDAPVRMRL